MEWNYNKSEAPTDRFIEVLLYDRTVTEIMIDDPDNGNDHSMWVAAVAWRLPE